VFVFCLFFIFVLFRFGVFFFFFFEDREVLSAAVSMDGTMLASKA